MAKAFAGSKKTAVGQRVNNRFQVPSSKINLSKAGIIVKLLGKKEYRASLVNLSETGFQIVTSDELRPDEECVVSIFIPGGMNAKDIKAKVVWSKFFRKEIHTRFFRVGFMFTKIAPEAVAKLKRLEKKYLS